MRKVAFVDRDGTLIWEPERPDGIDPRETFPLKSADEVRFMEGTIEGLTILVNEGYELVLVTNQTHLGTPRHPQEIFDAVMERMTGGLEKEGAHFAFVMVCPHGPDDGCECRKPKIGGLAPFLTPDIDLSSSLMFGDRDSDREFAQNLGVRFVPITCNERFVLPENR
ncbi:MAG: HAD-IIIA family hydrolase [Candidatus Pacebacteria bacterium]|nr:HAD-IIIA family hydrolase [Candidatus Paceibacterota bacterium]